MLQRELWLRPSAELRGRGYRLTVVGENAEPLSARAGDGAEVALVGGEEQVCENEPVGRRRKLYESIASGRSDANVSFDGARNLLAYLGFEESVRGSHHKFTRGDIEELINLQEVEGGKCKPYQVKQMRTVLERYNLGEEL